MNVTLPTGGAYNKYPLEFGFISVLLVFVIAILFGFCFFDEGAAVFSNADIGISFHLDKSVRQSNERILHAIKFE